MVRFSVDPGPLRAVADKVDAVRAEVAAGSVGVAGGDVGHPDLANAAAAFQSKASTSWSEQVQALEEIVTRLRGSASVYDSADQDAAPRTASAGEGLPLP